MAVFTGMLIATILGVCLVPVLFVTVEKVIGRGKHAGTSRRYGTRRRSRAGGH